MSAPLKVLQVSNSNVFGGAEEHVRSLVKYLSREGIEVLVAVPLEGEFAAVLECEGIECLDNEIRGKLDVVSWLRLAHIIRRRGVDVVHTHNRLEDLAGALAARWTGRPVVTTIHDKINMTQDGQRVRNFAAKFYCRMLRGWFDRLITVSEATRADCIEEAGVSPDRIVHVVNGMDLERLDFQLDVEAKRRDLGLPSDAVVFGLVARVRGRDIGKKGHRYFIEAAGRMSAPKTSGPKMSAPKTPGPKMSAPKRSGEKRAAFVIVGEDEEARRFLLEIAREAGVASRMTFLGYRHDILEVMSCFDVVVLPSLFEGLPRTLMEGMAMGKPAVGARVDGIAELVTDEETGLLVEPRDAVALASAMQRLLDDEARKRMGEAAARRIRSNFDAATMARRTAEIYQEIVENRSLRKGQ